MNLARTMPLKYFVACVVVFTSVVGYFVGLQSPIKAKTSDTVGRGSTPTLTQAAPGVLPATSYSQMESALQSLHPPSQSSQFGRPPAGTGVPAPISPAAKRFAIAAREQNRAFNGAPPTVPHAIDQMSSRSCMACHGEGTNTATLRISKMSHPYFSNCTQCHVERSPTFMQPLVFRQSSFVGLATPLSGPRANPNAPPQIPHATWMRNDCLSCHGSTGNRGLQTTHPWRTNCLQCHTPSAEAEQLALPKEPKFLQPPQVE